MPTRMVREGILSSERVNALGDEAEVFYRRLMSKVDDYGRCEAHTALLLAALYPLKLKTTSEEDIERLLHVVERVRLIRLYVVAGKRYLEILDFGQTVRSKSKCPAPPPLDGGGNGAAPAAPAVDLPSTRTADAEQPTTVAAQMLSTPPASVVLGVSVFGGVSVSEGEDGGAPGARAHTHAREGPREAEPNAEALASPAGAVCKALRGIGMAQVSPSHPLLLELLAAGATSAEFVDAAESAKDKRDPFAYVLSVVRGRRDDAAAAGKRLHRGPMPQRETPSQREARERVEAASPTLAARRRRAAGLTDAEVVDVTARRLG